MLRRRELTVGKGYINDEAWLVREVVNVGRKKVKYNTYHLSTGQLCGAQHECKKEQFILWADRQATHQEMSNIQHTELDALFSHEIEPQDYEPSREPEYTMFTNPYNR